jgi:hypothetical protein
MPSYDASYFTPPAPVARVTLRRLDQRTADEDVPMLLDTGADVSLVPRAAIDKLAIAVVPAATFQLLSFDGRASEAPAVDLEMIFCQRLFRGRFLILDHDWGVLGRNILNLLPILFDGPHLAWDLRKPENYSG